MTFFDLINGKGRRALARRTANWFTVHRANSRQSAFGNTVHRATSRRPANTKSPKNPLKKRASPTKVTLIPPKTQNQTPILLSFLLQHHLNRCPNSVQITKAQVVISHHRQLPNRVKQLKRFNNISASLEFKRAPLNSRLVCLNRQIFSQFK